MMTEEVSALLEVAETLLREGHLKKSTPLSLFVVEQDLRYAVFGRYMAPSPAADLRVKNEALEMWLALSE